MEILAILDGFGNEKQTQYYLAPRFIWGLKNQFEKTKPIFRRAK
jgi:hypothetical protein